VLNLPGTGLVDDTATVASVLYAVLATAAVTGDRRQDGIAEWYGARVKRR
jgi:hypothetical protein